MSTFRKKVKHEKRDRYNARRDLNCSFERIGQANGLSIDGREVVTVKEDWTVYIKRRTREWMVYEWKDKRVI